MLHTIHTSFFDDPHTGTIYSKGGTITHQVYSILQYINEEVNFLSKTHLVYAVPALIISVLLFLLPLLLILYPACYKVFSALGIGEASRNLLQSDIH